MCCRAQNMNIFCGSSPVGRNGSSTVKRVWQRECVSRCEITSKQGKKIELLSARMQFAGSRIRAAVNKSSY